MHQGQHEAPVPAVDLGELRAAGGAEVAVGGLPTPTRLFLQVSDWFVDFSVPGGTDPEGWQYASDFPA